MSFGGPEVAFTIVFVENIGKLSMGQPDYKQKCSKKVCFSITTLRKYNKKSCALFF